tara:strand:- start:267 stop:392 length:126 start_codon:yes stop_codon:yes gene_type:complete
MALFSIAFALLASAIVDHDSPPTPFSSEARGRPGDTWKAVL